MPGVGEHVSERAEAEETERLTLRDHETTRVPSTQPTTTKLPRFSAWRGASWGAWLSGVATGDGGALTSPKVVITL